MYIIFNILNIKKKKKELFYVYTLIFNIIIIYNDDHDTIYVNILII